LKPVYDEDLSNFEDWLRRLKVEYDVFFNGHRKKPPDDLKARVEKLVKKLSECPDMSFQQRFRYNTLAARFHVFRDLWRRALQEREQGATEQAQGPAVSEADSPPAVREINVTLADPVTEEVKVRQLYEALLRLRGTRAEERTQTSYSNFAAYIGEQTLKIRGKFGCSSVVFTVARVDDAIRFTAKAAGDRQPIDS